MMMFIFIPLAQGQGSSPSPKTKDLLLPQPAPRGTAEATLGWWGCLFERRSSPNLLPTQSEGMEHLALQHLVLMMFQDTPKTVQVLRHLLALLGQCIWQLRGLKSGKDQIFTGAVQFLTQIECATTQHGQHRIRDPTPHKQGGNFSWAKIAQTPWHPWLCMATLVFPIISHWGFWLKMGSKTSSRVMNLNLGAVSGSTQPGCVKINEFEKYETHVYCTANCIHNSNHP